MKILLVSFYYYPELGAAPSRITNMAEGFRREGADVDVLTSLPNYPRVEFLTAIGVVFIKKRRQAKERCSAIGLTRQCRRIR